MSVPFDPMSSPERYSARLLEESQVALIAALRNNQHELVGRVTAVVNQFQDTLLAALEEQKQRQLVADREVAYLRAELAALRADIAALSDVFGTRS